MGIGYLCVWPVDFTLGWFWCESWVLSEDWSGTYDMAFVKVRLFGLFVSFHGSVPIHVYVASDGSGSNVMGELRMTQNNWCLFVAH